MFKKQEIEINVEKNYAKSVISKIKNILWNNFDTNAEIENYSFSNDENQVVKFYFISSDKQLEDLKKSIRENFYLVLIIKA
ncbi:hypothetical protein KUA55_10355 [Enterococcus sp. ALS3]|uniref:Uncharacterized protein n=1 Tax=Enterococcus alishanensis TaxID=1303817 RepID=A0ABS6TDT3_9ENTE|nr:hypothetical protein [Enterococcus alishanensis]MBV7391083.1 hypothetical protein [Enterococcus alishanensis]